MPTINRIINNDLILLTIDILNQKGTKNENRAIFILFISLHDITNPKKTKVTEIRLLSFKHDFFDAP